MLRIYSFATEYLCLLPIVNGNALSLHSVYKKCHSMIGLAKLFYFVIPFFDSMLVLGPHQI